MQVQREGQQSLIAPFRHGRDEFVRVAVGIPFAVGISLLSLVFGCLAGTALVGAGAVEHWPRAVLFLAAACIQLRLLCNLFDGMVAVEGGFKTKSGEIYNELPDRVADVLILAGAGYAMPSSEWLHSLGWLAAVLR